MPRVLFVHGAAGDARVWQPVIDALGSEFDARAVTLTYFGTGNWPDSGENFGTELHAADIERAASGGGVHLVSWSMGTQPALKALCDAPHLFASALFYEPGLATFVEDETERAAWAADAHAAFAAVAQALHESGERAAVDAMIGERLADLSEERRQIYRDNARTMPLLMGGGRPPAEITAAELASVDCPTRIAMGASARPCFAIPSRGLAGALPSSELVIVESADHFLPEVDPARFATLVRDWLSRTGVNWRQSGS